MKTYEATAFAIIRGITRDATIRWPNLGASLELDLSYLHKAFEARGFVFLTITLPTAAKAFLQWLDRGCMVVSDLPQGYPITNKRPRLWGSLIDMLFDDQGRLVQDADAEVAYFLLQLLSCCKNIRLNCHPSRTEETLDEFFAIEARLPKSHKDTWDSDVPRWEDRHGHPLWGLRVVESEQNELALLDNRLPHDPDLNWSGFRQFCLHVTRRWIGFYPEWNLRPRHGPGAVAERLREGVKYDFPNWPSKLESVFPYDWYGSGLLAHELRPDQKELPSRLISVPKTQKGPRLICSEPTSHQWMQQALADWLETRIRYSPLARSVDFHDQGRSRERAQSSSIDASLCTIDLSSASDRISTRLVEYCFQGSNLLDAMHACRTRFLTQDLTSNHPGKVVIRKFSTMGSALTFPIQSIVFLILSAWGVTLTERAEGREISVEDALSRVTVYGDDIIAPNAAYPAIKRVLHSCGLKVNDAKTFTGSYFRESCGMYAFKGVDITPAYYLEAYDGSPDSLTATVECSNNFHKKGCWTAASIVADQIPEQERKKLPVIGLKKVDGELVGVGGLGLVSFCGPGIHLLRKRWCKELQAAYQIVLTVVSKSRITKGTGESSLTQFFTEKPDPRHIWESGAEPPRKWESGRTSSVSLRKRLTRSYLHQR